MRTTKGFTLIELSIVLVIIGLIVGGVLVGQDLIQAAKLRSAGSDLKAYSIASNAFRLKYNCLPGDCPNATMFFGRSDQGLCDAHPGQPSSTGTCNGNGNKQALSSDGFAPSETGIFWQHLSLSELIGHPYDATASAYRTFDYLNSTMGLQNDDYAIGNTKISTLNISVPNNTLMETIVILDMNLDDGKANSGAIQAGISMGSPYPTASDGCVDAAGDYNPNLDTAVGVSSFCYMLVNFAEIR